MAWSSNRFCDFGVALNPPVQGPQTGRNKGSAPKFNPSATNNSTTAVTKLESIRAGTTAVSVLLYSFFLFFFYHNKRALDKGGHFLTISDPCNYSHIPQKTWPTLDEAVL